jgi:NitT/TauT family transport system ATP-binding protein
MTSAPPQSLVASGVGHAFRDRAGRTVRALEGIEFHLRQGEFFSVIGPSGCGKSTLLEILAGLVAPTDGSVTFEGRPVNGTVPDGIGVVFQEDASFPWLTVAENVAFGLRRAGVESGEIARRVDDALRFMGLRDFAQHHPAQLSGGMRQRVCIARTLVQQPRLILLDEPFAALDQQTRLVMGDELLRLWRTSGATVILITHSLDEAAMLSDRIGVMSGRPGRFIEVLETGHLRDRDSRILGDPRCAELTAAMWSHLREESLRAVEPAAE